MPACTPPTWAPGWPRRRGRTVGGCPWIEPFNEVLFPGVVAIGLGAAGLVIALRDAAWRELVLFYGLTAFLALWLSFGPDAGLYTAFFHTIPVFSFLRAPARIGIVVRTVPVGVCRDSR